MCVFLSVIWQYVGNAHSLRHFLCTFSNRHERRMFSDLSRQPLMQGGLGSSCGESLANGIDRLCSCPAQAFGLSRNRCGSIGGVLSMPSPKQRIRTSRARKKTHPPIRDAIGTPSDRTSWSVHVHSQLFLIKNLLERYLTVAIPPIY